MNKFKLSRYWNRFAYLVIDLGVKMLWDYTGRNTDIIDETVSAYVKEMMTSIPKQRSK